MAAASPVRRLVRSVAAPMLEAAVAAGFPARWTGWRAVRHETVPAFFARRGQGGPHGRIETLAPARRECNPLPRTFSSRDLLPMDRGWWGYSFHDVPERESGETFLATVRDPLVTWYRDPARGNDFYPAILAGDGTALDLREIRFRPLHGRALRQGGPALTMRRATWIAERCYHNHSHWLTAHLPKLLLLRDHGLLDTILLPPERTAVMDASLRMLGLEPGAFATWDPARPLRVAELTVVGTDRFRPDLLRRVPEAYGITQAPPPRRKVFISRAGAARRVLVNEAEVWPILAAAGFERVRMEDLDFPAQVALMRETAVLCAPHGAGLTNMMLCPAGATVVEMADLSFPNPNFYALAAALGHDYWVLPAALRGEGRPIDRDLWIDPAVVAETVAGFSAAMPHAVAEGPW